MCWIKNKSKYTSEKLFCAFRSRTRDLRLFRAKSSVVFSSTLEEQKDKKKSVSGKKSFLIQSRRERTRTGSVLPFSVLFGRSGVFMMSSMFKIPILYVACDVKIKKGCHCCSRVLRKIQLQKFMFWRAFFEKKLVRKRGAGEANEQNRLFLFKNLILLNLPSLTKRSLGRGRWRCCARTNKRGRCRFGAGGKKHGR